MQILLNQDVPSIGKKGDIITVSEGYGRNFLLRKKLGIIPTAQDIARKNSQVKQSEANEKAHLEALTNLKSKLENYSLTFVAKTNTEGHLFGAIKESDIVSKLNSEFGALLEKSMIHIASPIKAIGDYTIDIHLNPIIKTKIELYVKSENE
jgi:large subunit ribosomal protein L9